MPSPSLSVVIIAFNEERNLPHCLDSLEGIADEVLVVDSGSTDRTVALAEERGARVLNHAFEGHIE
ncbi:MAG: glycosyltransferase, partial [Flavobacteriales bacterium]